jgi:hypothetical protein
VVLAPGREIGPEDIPQEIRRPGASGRLLPVPVSRSAGAVSARPARDGVEEEPATGSGVRPELEFVFRTLVELRMDMDQLRREFEAYREETDERLEGAGETWLLPDQPGVEVGIAPRTPAGGSGRMAGGDQGTDGEEREVEGYQGRAPEVIGGEEESAEGDGAVIFRPGMTMEELEEEAIRRVLAQTGGNRRQTAESLGIGERTLYRKIKKYGIEE